MSSYVGGKVRGGGDQLSRRTVVKAATGLGVAAGIEALLPSYGRANQQTHGAHAVRSHTQDGVAVHELTVAETGIEVSGRRTTAVTINGTVPGPLLRLREGQDTILRVANRLSEDTSVHWHGLIVPPEMDGVPGLSFAGIRPGTTFEYRFKLRQYGTYWYHSHSGLQEQLGHYGPLIIDPASGAHPYKYDREYVILLSDWTFENPYRVLAKLKKQPDYYNFQKRTVFDFFSDVRQQGFTNTVRDRSMWARMRMNPTDVMDVTGATYTFLMNGRAPEANWTGLFRKGERILLHVINAAADTYFDVRVPGLAMTVVQSNGQYVQPVETDEFRIAIAETYDVIVQPDEDRPFAVFAETIDRSGYAAGTLAPRSGMKAPLPARRQRPVLTMADMGMQHGNGGHGAVHAAADATPSRKPSADHAGHQTTATANVHADHGSPAATGPHAGHGAPPTPADHAGHGSPAAASEHAGHGNQTTEPQTAHAGHGGGPSRSNASGSVKDAATHAVAGAIRTAGLRPPGTLPSTVPHEKNTHGPGNAAVPDIVKSRLAEPGIGLGEDGWRVLVYTDLRALERRPDFKPPTREIEMHLTGNMERFMWSIDGVPFVDSKPIHFDHNERLRLTMVNDTMMNHPMHLHGMWMELENGHGDLIPRVHTINVKPAERLSVLITADAPGRWAFHCHVLYHMEVGMFRVVEVGAPRGVQPVSHHDH